MEEIIFASGSVPVAVAARVYGKDASWIRAGIVSGWLPIGKATRNGKLVTNLEEMNSKYGRINFYISPKLLWQETGYNIYNTETREVMKIDTGKLQKLTGKGIVASDDIVINTSKGDKSITLIREGVSYNILNCLDKNTDWFTLAKGDNIFAFTADSGVTNLQFRIENKVIYEGV